MQQSRFKNATFTYYEVRHVTKSEARLELNVWLANPFSLQLPPSIGNLRSLHIPLHFAASPDQLFAISSFSYHPVTFSGSFRSTSLLALTQSTWFVVNIINNNNEKQNRYLRSTSAILTFRDIIEADISNGPWACLQILSSDIWNLLLQLLRSNNSLRHIWSLSFTQPSFITDL